MQKPSLAQKDYLTVIETAELFHFSRRKRFRLVEKPNLPFMTLYGTRKLVIKRSLLLYSSLIFHLWNPPLFWICIL